MRVFLLPFEMYICGVNEWGIYDLPLGIGRCTTRTLPLSVLSMQISDSLSREMDKPIAHLPMSLMHSTVKI